MRIIHTSDWHLGQNFMGKTRETEHKAFLDWLLDLIEAEQVDALVVSGDIFDTGTPPSYARTGFFDFIASLDRTCCRQAVFIGGNHDSPATLLEGQNVLERLNTKIRARISGDPADHLILLKDSRDNPGALLCAVPFIRPRDLVSSSAGQTGQDKKQALADAIARVYEDAWHKAGQTLKQQGRDLPILATGHLTLVGGKASESVREIYIGSLDAFPISRLPRFDYMALGHLHRPQQIKGDFPCFYSGSPIPLSFDEGHAQKQVMVVETGQGTVEKVKPVPVPGFRKLMSVHGTLAQIQDQLARPDLTRDLAPSDPAPWLEVVVQGPAPDIQARVLDMIRDMDIELLRIKRKAVPGEPEAFEDLDQTLESLGTKEVFLKRLASEDIDDQTRGKLMGLFQHILDDVETGQGPPP